MRGTIVHYNATEGCGLIAAQDGQQYPFAIGAWRSGIAPRVNQSVELDTTHLLATAVTLVPRHVLLKEKAFQLLARLGIPLPAEPPHR